MATEPVKILGTLIFKRGTKADLEAMEEILALGEPAYEIDTKKLKVGNGELEYINLPYIGSNNWCEEQVEELTNRVENAEESINAFLREAEVGTEAVDTLKEIQASLDAGEVSAANLLNKVNELEAVHETYVEEHKQIREDLVGVAEDAETEFALIQEQITQEKTTREAQDKLLSDSAAHEHQAIRNEISSGLLNAQTDRTAIKKELAEKNNAQTAALNAEIARAQTAEDTVLSEAKAYTDKVKTDILGEGIAETFDTLVEIQDWINGEGVNATELTSAIAAETKARNEEDIAIRDEYKAADSVLEESLKNYFDTELGVIANGTY